MQGGQALTAHCRGKKHIYNLRKSCYCSSAIISGRDPGPCGQLWRLRLFARQRSAQTRLRISIADDVSANSDITECNRIKRRITCAAVQGVKHAAVMVQVRVRFHQPIHMPRPSCQWAKEIAEALAGHPRKLAFPYKGLKDPQCLSDSPSCKPDQLLIRFSSSFHQAVFLSNGQPRPSTPHP